MFRNELILSQYFFRCWAKLYFELEPEFSKLLFMTKMILFVITKKSFLLKDFVKRKPLLYQNQVMFQKSRQFHTWSRT